VWPQGGERDRNGARWNRKGEEKGEMDGKPEENSEGKVDKGYGERRGEEKGEIEKERREGGGKLQPDFDSKFWG